MKSILEPVLASLLADAIANVFKTCIIRRSIDISDISPNLLVEWAKNNNVPIDKATFEVKQEAEFGYHIPVLEWDETEALPGKANQDRIKRWFNANVSQRVFEAFNNNYKRVSPNMFGFRKFSRTSVYDMFVNGEIDQICDYYSMYFQPK